MGFRCIAAKWVTGWVSKAWSQDGFLRRCNWMDGILRHDRWVGFRGMAAGSLDGFLRHGHWVGFRGMAAGRSLDGFHPLHGF